MGNGFCVFLQGAVKFRLLGEGLHIFYETLRTIPQEEVSVLGVCIGVFALGLSVYLRFSGCADMARGVAGMMGISLPKNFNYPFQARSIGDFIARFNFSLRDYLREALGPRYADGFTGLLVIGIASGLWFGLSIGLLAWGLFLTVFLLLERRLYPGFTRKPPILLGNIYTLLVILIGFAMFGANSLSEIAQTLSGMFGFADLPLESDRLWYLLDSNRLLLIAAALLTTSFITRLGAYFKARLSGSVSAALSVLLSLVLLALLSAFLL